MDPNMEYRQRCAVTLGANALFNAHATWPMSSITFFFDKVILSTGVNRLTLRYDEIVSVERYAGLFFIPGIKVNHTSPRKKYAVCFAFDNSRILERFRTHGVKVVGF